MTIEWARPARVWGAKGGQYWQFALVVLEIRPRINRHYALLPEMVKIVRWDNWTDTNTNWFYERAAGFEEMIVRLWERDGGTKAYQDLLKEIYRGGRKFSKGFIRYAEEALRVRVGEAIPKCKRVLDGGGRKRRS